ncbi:MAG: hypothetical protein GY839_15435 [candidate division Zixibacteria bacterium]|nr:hypothetical protein [candidate division Zixibacteria bacterium]
MRLNATILISGMALMTVLSYDDCLCAANISDHQIEIIEKADSSAADSSYQGRIRKYALKIISDKSETFELNIKLPAGNKFNHAAPFDIKASSDKPEIIEIGEYDIKRGTRKLKLPVKVKPGEATLNIDLNFSYCGIVNKSLCYF